LDGLEGTEKDETIGSLVNLFLDVNTSHIQIDLEEILDGLAGSQSDLVGSKIEPAQKTAQTATMRATVSEREKQKKPKRERERERERES